MENSSLLQLHRCGYQPTLPLPLCNLTLILKEEKEVSKDPDVKLFFPCTYDLPLLSFTTGGSQFDRLPLKVGVVFSGGQAPGGHNVIAGLFDSLKNIHPDSTLIGFMEGPSGIIKNKFISLNEETISLYRNQGGFDIIGSGRTKIETDEQFEAARDTLQTHDLDGLVIIGGDDSNTNAALLAEYCKQKKMKTIIVGVPKTIDGDLKNDCLEISFGFDSASKVYGEMIGNLAKDCLSAKKHTFFIKMMGRSASHLTLECALQTHVNMALIGEEILEKRQTLNQIIQEIADLICERSLHDKNFGLILIPEGLLEFIPECQSLIIELNRLLSEDPLITEKIGAVNSSDQFALIQQKLSPQSDECFSKFPQEIQKQLLMERDPHGNIQLSKIETERLIITLVQEELKKRKSEGQYSGIFNPQPVFYGYEGRAALPSNFDCEYCYALGYLASLLILHQASGYMCVINNLIAPAKLWEIGGIPIVSMLHLEIRKNKQKAVIKKALVDLKGAVFNRFQQERSKWRLADDYCSPGPIQFDGPEKIVNSRTMTLILERGHQDALSQPDQRF
ncbi:MAG: diphosphate--fructose-6-phosphate 1-phosphotransferase [Parachlamydiaceae bacterium]